MSFEYRIAETDLFQTKLKDRQFSHLQKKLVNYIFPILKKNPFFGPNIKKLKGEFSDLYKYRIGNYRLFYIVQDKELLLILIDIEQKKNSYR